MRRYAQRSFRPLLITAVILLLGSLITPWMWREHKFGPTLAKFSDGHRQSPRHEPRPAQRASDSILRPTAAAQLVADVLPIESSLLNTAEVSEEIDWEPAAQQFSERNHDSLEQFEIIPQLASLDPPRAELIELDPSLAETPVHPSKKIRHSDPVPYEPDVPPMPEELEAPLPPPVDRMPPVISKESHGVWPHATVLIEQLQQLGSESPESQVWSQQTIDELEAVSHIESLSDPTMEQRLKNLRQLAGEMQQYDTPQIPTRNRTLRLRAGYGILRRLAVWDPLFAVANANIASPNASLDAAALANSLEEIEAILQNAKAAENWRSYLRCNELIALTKATGEPTAEQRLLARDVLRRLHSPRLDHRQHAFLSGAPFCDLVDVLKPAAQDNVDWSGLLDAIERHEANNSTVHTRKLAQELNVMQWSSQPLVQSLAWSVNENYRNANMRLALSEQLINRFIPGPQLMVEPVADNIRGAEVVGRSESLTRLRIALIPDRRRWRLGLDAHGAVTSATESSKGPARFWNDGVGQFNARKVILLDRRGLAVNSAQASANADAHLTDFETNYDPIPLLGPIVRSIARQQYDKEQGAARSEIEGRISDRASSRLNQEVDKRVLQAEREFQTRFIEPLDRLNLEPTAVAMETTPRRLVVRYRLAGPHQLSAQTPRPQAPGNSMLSLQLHDSMLNNALENLQLDNRRVELRTLYVEMLRRFDAKQIVIPDDLPEDVTVQFAERDALRITCEDGRVRIAIRLKELNHADTNTWRNFEVRGYYRPSDNQLEANLVRDGNIELSGERLRLGDQIALRGIFAKVMSRNRQLSLVNKQLLARPELTDLQVTQFIVQDGWIGIALGPKSDNVRPTPVPTTEESQEVARRSLRTKLQHLR